MTPADLIRDARRGRTDEQAPKMRIGYADQPYVGCAHLYKSQPDFAGEVIRLNAMLDQIEASRLEENRERYGAP